MKTETEIIAAHKSTIETFTGKQCDIKLISDEERIISRLTMHIILEYINCISIAPIEGAAQDRETSSLRKIFSLIASEAGHSSKSIGAFLNGRNHSTILYNLKTAKHLLTSDCVFKTSYDSIKSGIVQANKNLLRSSK
jgi:chromosomal replication initiation ATPase DnaA